MNLDAPRSRRGIATRREQRDYVIVVDFHDFRRDVAPVPMFFTHRHLGSEVLTKGIGIFFSLRNWLFRVLGNLLKVLVPLGIKFGGKARNAILKTICLGTKNISLKTKGIRFA